MVRPSARSDSACAWPVTTTPPSTSPWPARYLVTLCTLKWAPNSKGRSNSGVANVLSTTSAAPADLGMMVNAHAQQRVRNALHHNAPRVGLFHHGAQAGEIADIGEAYADAQRLEHVHQQADGSAVHHIGRHDGAAAIGQRAQDGGVQRRHARQAG